MIIEKSHDTDEFSQSLDQALQKALHADQVKGVWVQKYDDQGDELWDASFVNYRIGKNLLSDFELEGVKSLYEKIQLSGNAGQLADWFESLESLLYKRWEERNTIQVEREVFQDHYDMYGMTASCFC